jgi:two-component sensor histidine kinase
MRNITKPDFDQPDLLEMSYLLLFEIYDKEIVEVSLDFYQRIGQYGAYFGEKNEVSAAWYHLALFNYWAKSIDAEAGSHLEEQFDLLTKLWEVHQFEHQNLTVHYWIAAAIYHRWKGSTDVAISYIDRIILVAGPKDYFNYDVFSALLWKCQILAQSKQYEAAKESMDFAKQYFSIADSLRSEFLFSRFAAYYYYNEIGAYDSAYALLDRSILLGNQLDYRKNSLKMSEMEVRLDTAEKEVVLANQASQLKVRRIQLIAAVLFVLLMAFLAALMIKSRNRIQQKNERISTLMRELHHRVKNNLQVISSLLGLQSMRLEDAVAQKAVNEGKERIRAMSLIHQKLYQQEEVSSVHVKDYVENLVSELTQSYGFADRATVELSLPDVLLDADTTLPLGLIINELVSNAFKYAFNDPNVNPILTLTLIQDAGNHYLLTISDNGPGLPTDFDFSKASSFGLKLVNLLIKQLKGNINLDSSSGAFYEISFHIK